MVFPDSSSVLDKFSLREKKTFEFGSRGPGKLPEKGKLTRSGQSEGTSWHTPNGTYIRDITGRFCSFSAVIWLANRSFLVWFAGATVDKEWVFAGGEGALGVKAQNSSQHKTLPKLGRTDSYPVLVLRRVLPMSGEIGSAKN